MQSHKHIWIFDFLRGLAVLGMIIFHLYFILSFFGIKPQQMHQGAWLYFGNIVRFTFISLVGISLSLSAQKKYSQVIRRALLIILGALVISLATYIFAQANTVRFGILHFIGVGIFLALPFRKFKYINLIMAIMILLISFYLPIETHNAATQNSVLGFIFGTLSTQSIPDLDYFPLFPWLSLIFLGIFIGNSIKNSFIKKLTNPPKILKPITYIGKNSLAIYMVHIPAIILIISLFIGQNLFLPQF